MPLNAKILTRLVFIKWSRRIYILIFNPSTQIQKHYFSVLNTSTQHKLNYCQTANFENVDIPIEGKPFPLPLQTNFSLNQLKTYPAISGPELLFLLLKALISISAPFSSTRLTSWALSSSTDFSLTISCRSTGLNPALSRRSRVAIYRSWKREGGEVNGRRSN